MFYLKTGIYGILNVLIPNPNLDFEILTSKFRPKKSILSVLPKNSHTWYLGRASSESIVRFYEILTPKSIFGEIWDVEVYMKFSSCFKAWLKQNFFDMKYFNYNYNLIYATFFSLIALIFIFASKPPSVSLQSHPQDTLCVHFHAK